MFSPATVVTLVVFGAIGALIGWRRGTKALYRRSVSEPNLAPGESRRDYERRWRRRRKIQRLSGTLVYCVVGIGIALVVLAVATTGR